MQLPDPDVVAVIINASAGAGCTANWAEQLTARFAAHGMQARLTMARSGSEVLAAADAALAAGISIIVAGGGDGTLNAVAGKLVGRDVAFGILPLGTLNHFARDLHIPLELDDAVRTIAGSHRVKIDVAEVNGQIFINNSSLGLYPDIVRHRELQQRRLGRGKWRAFFWALVAVMRRYPFLNVTVLVEGVEHKRRTPFVFVGNNVYQMEGFHIGERAALNRGRLSVYATNHTGRTGLLMLMLRALFGRLRQARDFDAMVVTELLIETHHKRLRISTDGEVNVFDTPLCYRIRPAALTVIVPPSP